MSVLLPDANASGASPPGPTVFDRFIKEHALKILLDYSDSTGRKWLTITNEIVQHASRKRLHQAPSLDRSSLEQWASGKKGIGNEKFQLVYEFLTHPDTLARPELAHASILKDPYHALLRTGRVLADFYRHPLAGPRGADHSVETIEVSKRWSGVYEGSHNGENIVLSVEDIEGEEFCITHFLTSKSRFDLDLNDLHFDRFSGYLTESNLVTAHLKPVYGGGTRILWVVRPEFQNRSIIQVITSSVIHRNVSEIWRSNIQSDSNKLDSVNFEDYTFILRRSDSQSVIDLISNFRWRVPL